VLERCGATITNAMKHRTPGNTKVEMDVIVQHRGEPPHVSSKPLDEKYWLERAREAGAQADLMTQPEAKRMMLEIAAGYQRLAQMTEERTGCRKPSSS